MRRAEIVQLRLTLKLKNIEVNDTNKRCIYIADFYCHQHKLIIEIDGSIHNLPEIIKNDLERQISLENDGMKFLRFKNDEIFNHLEKVLDSV